MRQPLALFKPGSIGRLKLKNRLVMAAMGNSCAYAEGYVNDQLIAYYEARAAGGVGLIVSQVTNVSPKTRVPGRLSIDSDMFVLSLKKLSSAVHAHDAKIALQLLRPGAGLLRERLEIDDPEFIVPSVLPQQGHPSHFREASKGDISHITAEFAEAAGRAKDAGFDAVEFHGCHGPGSILWSFLSPFTNKREDEYGGSARKRVRICCEVIAQTRDRVGGAFPIIFRINGFDGIEGGTTLEEAMQQAVLLEEAGADAVSLSAGVLHWSSHLMVPQYFDPVGFSARAGAKMKHVLTVPVISAGRITPDLAETLLRQHKADFVAMGRPLLADPDLPKKLLEQRIEEIRPCVYCNNCLLTSKPADAGRRSCTANPALLREGQFDLRPSRRPRNVMVVGGGLAGMEAAQILAARGDRVTLYELGDCLGGQWNVASTQAHKEGFRRLTDYLSRSVEKTGVKIVLNTRVTAKFIEKRKPDVVVVATGAQPKRLEVKGTSGPDIVQANDVVLGRAKVGKLVVVVGGRALGMELADMLAGQGKRVALVTRHALGRGVELSLFETLRDRLAKRGVPVYQNSAVSEVLGNGLYCLVNGEMFFLRADTIVLAVGAIAVTQLVDDIKGVDPKLPVYMVGDCREPGNGATAMANAAEVAYRI